MCPVSCSRIPLSYFFNIPEVPVQVGNDAVCRKISKPVFGIMTDLGYLCDHGYVSIWILCNRNIIPYIHGEFLRKNYVE